MAPTKEETPKVSPEMVKIDSLEKLKQELKVDSLDVSNEKELESPLKFSREELDKLHTELLGMSGDTEKLERIKKIIEQKQVVIVKTGKEAGFLRSKIENLLVELNIRNVKSALDNIEQLENEQDRVFLTNILIGALESNGYSIFINSDKIEIDPKTKSSPELEMLLNNKISQNKTTLDNFKIAILQRTTSLDDYITANTDKNGKLINEKIDAKSYYEFLVKKSGLDTNMFVSIDDIKKNPNLNQKDKAFMISYKNNAFDDVKIDEKMKQFQDEKVELNQKIEKMTPVERQEFEDKIKIPGDNRTLQQRTGDFLKDPFSEIGTIMKNAGPIGLLGILGALIYFMFKEPKLVFGSIAGWGLAKGIGLADHFGNAIEGTNGAREPYKAGIEYSKEMVDWAWIKVKGIPKQISGSIEELNAKIIEWGNFKDTQFIDAAGNKKEILDSNFLGLYNSKDGFPNKLNKEDGKPVSKEESQELNQRLTKLYNKGIENYGKDFLKKVEKMSVAEVIDFLIEQPVKTPAQEKGADAPAKPKTIDEILGGPKNVPVKPASTPVKGADAPAKPKTIDEILE